jgi:phage protein D
MDRLGFEEQKIIKDNQERRFTGGNMNGNDGMKPTSSDGIQVAFKAFGRSFIFPPHRRFKNEQQARRAIEQFIQRQKENFITGEGALVGNEIIQSRQVIRLEGISNQFSGKYYLTKVLHKMSKSGGYTTEFTAHKVIVDREVQAPPALNLTENDKRFKRVKKEKA